MFLEINGNGLKCLYGYINFLYSKIMIKDIKIFIEVFF